MIIPIGNIAFDHHLIYVIGSYEVQIKFALAPNCKNTEIFSWALNFTLNNYNK